MYRYIILVGSRMWLMQKSGRVLLSLVYGAGSNTMNAQHKDVLSDKRPLFTVAVRSVWLYHRAHHPAGRRHGRKAVDQFGTAAHHTVILLILYIGAVS